MTYTHKNIVPHSLHKATQKTKSCYESIKSWDCCLCTTYTKIFLFFLFLCSALNFYCSFQSTTSHEFFMIKVLWTTVGIIIIYLTLKVIKKSPYFKLLSWVTQGRLSLKELFICERLFGMNVVSEFFFCTDLVWVPCC